MDHKKVSPLFNYIGGKSWLRNSLRKSVNAILEKKTNINSYTEPFAGGLGAFLGVYDILLNHKITSVILNDINSKLINFYNVVKNNPDKLIEEYIKLEDECQKTIPSEALTLNKTKDKDKLKTLLTATNSFYNKQREEFNKQQKDITSAALLLFLQNHCFNGVYRENSKGGYNTPFNWEARTIDKTKVKEKIQEVNEVFSKLNVTFTNKSFSDLTYDKDTLFYLDPPYVNEIISENKYHKDGFTVNKQMELIDCIKNFSFVYSNHDNKILEDKFNSIGRELLTQKIARKNIISASNESRKTDKIELLIETID